LECEEGTLGGNGGRKSRKSHVAKNECGEDSRMLYKMLKQIVKGIWGNVE
jgi:hypothetical protein